MNSMLTRNVYGLCLSAGLSTRLRPLTDHFPKAKLPIMGIPSLYAALDRLEQLGITDAAVNMHYHAEQVAKLVNEYPGNLKIRQSFEPVLLGTGGALWPLKSWLKERHLLLLNPDIICGVNLQMMMESHLSNNAIVTVGVMKPRDLSHIPSVHCARNTNRIVSLGKNQTQTNENLDSWYGLGVFLVSPKIFSYLKNPSGFSSLTDAFSEAISSGERLEVFPYHGYFRDFGDSLSSYYMCHMELCANHCRLLKELGFDQMARRLGETFCVSPYNPPPEDKIDVDQFSLFFGKPTFAPGVKIERSLVYGSPQFTPNQHLITSICIDNHCIGYEGDPSLRSG